ncbi:MAG: hypothetical protein LBT59_15600 [Clostridiales bacterium]|jgi:hypothetical protein|nr:hypothetical protein [Clostridiales bacterium]
MPQVVYYAISEMRRRSCKMYFPDLPGCKVNGSDDFEATKKLIQKFYQNMYAKIAKGEQLPAPSEKAEIIRKVKKRDSMLVPFIFDIPGEDEEDEYTEDEEYTEEEYEEDEEYLEEDEYAEDEEYTEDEEYEEDEEYSEEEEYEEDEEYAEEEEYGEEYEETEEEYYDDDEYEYYTEDDEYED